MAYRNGPIILEEYGLYGGLSPLTSGSEWTGSEDSLTGSETLRAKRESAINLQREMQIYKEAEEFSFDKFR